MAVTPSGSSKKPAPLKKKPPEKAKKEPVVSLVREQASNALRFSPYAWAKLIWLRDRGNTEISVFGVSRLDDLLYVEDVKIIKQVASVASFDFDEEYLNHYLVDMVQAGRQPCEVFRIWIHTHPGGSSPSSTDTETFYRTTKQADWGVMCIVGKDGAKYARMRLRVSGGLIAVDVTLEVKVDWSGEFVGVTNEDAKKWNVEYKKCVTHHVQLAPVTPTIGYKWHGRPADYDWGGVDNWDRSDMGDTGFLPEDDQADTPSDDDAGVDDFFGAQKIYLIELNDSGDTVVYTENYWFQYEGDLASELKVKEDEEISTPRGICDRHPEFWGEVNWNPTGETSLAYRTSVYYKGAFVELGEPEPASVGFTPTGEPKKEEEPQGELVGP